MKKLIVPSALLILVLCVSMLPAQQGHEKTTSSSEVTSANTELVLTGDKIVQPLMEIWHTAYPDPDNKMNITFSTQEISGDLTAVIEESSGMIMYSGAELDMPESYWKLKIAREAVVPVYNNSGSFAARIGERGLTQEQLIRVFTSGNTLTWGELLGTKNSEPVHVYLLNKECGASDVWARFLFTDAQMLNGREITGDEAMVEAIAGDPLSLGFCNLKYAYNLETKKPLEHVSILPMDLNINGRIDYIERIPNELKDMQRVIWLGSYPNNLCRPLWLIAGEKPAEISLQAFLAWALSDGQTLACENGYCRLRTHERDCQLNCLKPQEIE